MIPENELQKWLKQQNTRGTVLTLTLWNLLISVLDLLLISLFGECINQLTERQSFAWDVVQITVGVAVLLIFLRLGRKQWQNFQYFRILEREQSRFLHKLMTITDSKASKISEDERLQMLNRTIPGMCEFVTDTLPVFLGTCCSCVCYFVYGVLVNAWIALIVLVVSVGIAYYQYRNVQATEELYEIGERQDAEAMGFVRRAVQNAEITQLMLNEERIAKEAKDKLSARNSTWIRAMLPFFRNTSVGTAAYHITGFISIVIGAVFVVLGKMLIGEVYIVYRTANTLMNSIMKLPDSFAEIAQHKGYIKFMQTFWEQEEFKGDKKLEGVGCLSVENVYCTYERETKGEAKGAEEKDGCYILQDVSGRFERGRFYRIRGENGTGKSTLISVLAGELTISRGRILADNVMMTEVSREEWLREVVVCRQKPAFFPGTLLENIAGEEQDLQGVERVLREVGGRLAEGLIPRLQEEISVTGEPFSAGEAQMIALVRTVYGEKPAFLIFDEIVSQMDPDSRIRVLKYLKRCAQEGTGILMVSHDELPEEYFDEVMVLPKREEVCYR